MDDRSNRSRSGALHQPYLLPTFFLKLGGEERCAPGDWLLADFYPPTTGAGQWV